jgi:membrane protein implicated in regulation of membrane protease activity
MFYYFFLQYKNEVYLTNRNKPRIKELAMFVLLFISAVICAIQIMLSNYNITMMLSLVVVIVDSICMAKYIRKIENEGISDKVQNYKELKINCIVELLKSDIYNLYSLEGINWLIECCTPEINKSAYIISLQGLIFPVITLAYAVILNNLSLNEIVSISITFIGILVMIVILGNGLQPILDEILYPDKTKYKRLKTELEYIKSQL